MIRSCGCLYLCKPLPGPHVSVRRFFIQCCELRETGPWFRQVSTAINIPIMFYSAFLQHIQGRTINVVPFDRAKIVSGFSVNHHCLYQLREPSDSPRRSSLKLFASFFFFFSFSWVPHWGGFSDTLISSRQFDCSICDWEFQCFTIFGRGHFLCIESSSIDF